MANEMAIVPVGSVQVQPDNPIRIQGLELLDATDMAIPYIRVIQPTSTNAELMDGSEAKPGTFYNVALRIAETELFFSILSIAKFQVQWQEGTEPQLVYMVLGADQERQPFVLKVSGTSVFNLRQLITSIDKSGAEKAWEWMIHAVTEKREGVKDGVPTKWFQIKFYFDGKSDEETVAELDELAAQYKPEMALPDLEAEEVVDE